MRWPRGGWWRPRVSLGQRPPTPSAYINPPYPLAHSSHLLLSSLWPSSNVLSRARDLEKTPRAGHRHAAGFLVRVHLLPLLHWIGAQMTSIHCMCVIPQRRCSCGACLHRLVRLHDLEVGFGCLSRQCLCRNIPTHSVFKGMNTTAALLPYNSVE
jgi:hypothetical protein